MMTISNPTLSLTERPPFVGREHELSELTRILERLTTGGGGVVLIAGEPGIGKTRLLTELAARARLFGHLVVVGRSDETARMQPYVPFVEGLRDYLQQETAHSLPEDPAIGRLEISYLLQWATSGKGIVETPSYSFGDPSYRLRESIAACLLGIARAAPHGLLLCLDDLHWADTPSLLLLQHLARNVSAAPLLVVGAYRGEGLDRGHPLLDTLAELSRERVFGRLLLSPLSLDDASLLIQSLNGAAPSGEVARAIFRKSEGNPFFLEELIRHLRAEHWDLADPKTAAADWGVPDGVHDVLGKRLSHLSQETHSVLKAAAVVGKAFSLEILQGATELDLRTLAQAIGEAANAGMIKEQGEGYAFGHALLQEKLYGELSLPLRQLLHLKVARAIEAADAHGPRQSAAALATHYRLAGRMGDPAKAVEYSVRAGEVARAAYAYEEATAHWQGALDLMQHSPAAPERRAALLERLGTLTVATGRDVVKGIQYEEQALALYERMGLTQNAARVHSRLTQQFASHQTQDIDRALTHYRAAEKLLAQDEEPEFLGNLWSSFAVAASWAVLTPEALYASQRAMEIGTRQGNKALWASAAAYHGWNLCVSGRLSEGQALIERAWQVADEIDHPMAAFQAAYVMFRVAHEILCDPTSVPSWCEMESSKPRFQSLGVRRSLGYYQWIRRALMGELATTFGEVRDAWPEAYLAFFSGEWERAETLWTQWQTQTRGNRWNEWRNAYWLSHALRVQDRRMEAIRHLLETADLARECQAVATELQCRSELALLFTELDRGEEAQPHLDRCREIMASSEDWRGTAARVALAEGAVAGAVGDLASAEAYFGRAIELYRGYRLPWGEAEALQMLGRAYMKAGRRHRSRGLLKLDAAIQVYQRHNAAQPWISRVSADRDPTRRELPPSANPDGLSPREVGVLHLIAAGKTNREIARQLGISVNTVLHHTTSIFNKTSTTNRASAVSYAYRKGLLR